MEHKYIAIVDVRVAGIPAKAGVLHFERQDGSFNFQRVTLDPAPAAQRGFSLAVLHARQRVEQLDASGRDPWDWPKVMSEQACVTPYGLCDGFDLCRWGKP